MNKELYVSSTPHETKVALMEDDQLAEVFFERENEYTLAGSIYKGRVTRVLPGMQSAFVDIGLERDAFLYVSDFLELSGDEDEDEEFGEIPVPRGAIDLGKPQQVQEGFTVDPHSGGLVSNGGDDADLEPMFEEEAPSPMEAQAETSAADDQESGDGARRWRGRRRRGGRRGRGYQRNDAASESTSAAAAEQPAEPKPEARYESRPRQDCAPPAAYAPILLPGESISKYRNLSQPVAEAETQAPAAVPVEDFAPAEHAEPATQPAEEIAEEAVHLDQGFDTEETVTSVSEPEPAEQASAVVETTPVAEAEAAPVEEEKPRRGRWWKSRRKSAASAETQAEPAAQAEETVVAETEAAPVAEAVVDEVAAAPEQTSETTSFEAAHDSQHEHHDHAAQRDHRESAEHEHIESHVAGEQQPEHEVDTPAGSYEFAQPEQHSAPSSAPEGHTLEHEVLEEEEAEFQPMPQDLSAMREVAGDEELVLEEETLDSDNGYSERWVPKIEDVDEDEIVAAEERGEKIYPAEVSEEEDDEEAEGEEEEVADRAEMRAASPTAGYQQRNQQRPGYERRGSRFDRNRRGGPRRNNMRSRSNRHQPLITDLLKEGQEVLIQIAKEPIGKKGARITSHIALPGRFLVYMPTVNHTGVSRKISSEDERQRLKRIIISERENGVGGFIVRTAAAGASEEELRADIRFLKNLWNEIKTRSDDSKAPALI